MLRRLLSGELRERKGGRLQRMVGRDYFREAIVLLWAHCKTVDAKWDDLKYWEKRAREAPPEPKKGKKGKGRGRQGGTNRRRRGRRRKRSNAKG